MLTVWLRRGKDETCSMEELAGNLREQKNKIIKQKKLRGEKPAVLALVALWLSSCA